MMTKTQYLLGKLAEECNEVAQRALKTQQFGTEEIQEGQPFNNRQRLEAEIQDLHAILEMLEDHSCDLFDFQKELCAVAEKRLKVEKYLALSRKLKQVEMP